MSNNKNVVTFGIDLAKSLFHVCGLDANGKPVVSKKLRRTQIVTFLCQPATLYRDDGGLCGRSLAGVQTQRIGLPGSNSTSAVCEALRPESEK
jgi:hypothetical protein